MTEIVDVELSFNIYDQIVEVPFTFDIKPAVPVIVDVPFTFDVEGFSTILMVQDGELVRRVLKVRVAGSWIDPV